MLTEYRNYSLLIKREPKLKISVKNVETCARLILCALPVTSPNAFSVECATDSKATKWTNIELKTSSHFSGTRKFVNARLSINPNLDWAFFQPKKTGGGGQNGTPPNLAFSSQMTMKLGKGILWVEIFTN